MKRVLGTPKDLTGRLDKEIRVYQLLDNLKIPFERIDHRPLMTMEDCEEVDALLEAMICKNLFLHNAKKDQYYLLMIAGDKHFRSGEIASQIQSTRLSFASSEEMEKYLDTTPGSVSIMGLMNDREHRVQLLIDEELLEHEYIGCHPCVNTSSLRMKREDLLETYLKSIEHEPIWVKVESSSSI